MLTRITVDLTPTSDTTRRPFWWLLIFLVIAMINPASGRAQNSESACDKAVEQQVAGQDLNPGFEELWPLSSATIPAFGFATQDMSSAIDQTVGNYMNAWGFPGGAVAITHTDCAASGICTNHLIFAKSYGYLDVDNGLFAEPDTRFRIASVSKALTANAILTMVHDGTLKLDDKPFPLPDLVGSLIKGTLPGPFTPDAGTYNGHLSAITVDDMLHHAGGWDRLNGNPDLMGYQVLSELENSISFSGPPSGPPDCTQLMTFVETQPLQFKPGKQTAYSNVGFCALSEVIRETSGKSYFDYLKTNVLSPLGMNDTNMGFTPQWKRQDREAVYYDPNPNDPWEQSLFPPYPIVAPPYSSIGAIEAAEGAGGILSTAIDVARFAASVASGQPATLPGGPNYPHWPQEYYRLSALLLHSEESELPNLQYGLGWDWFGCPVFPPASAPPGDSPAPLHNYDNCNFGKNGGSPGTKSEVVATADGYGFAAVFNGGDVNNSAPNPSNEIFWPSCNTVPTPMAPSSANCALQAAYNHTMVQPWNVDFFPQYDQEYSTWMLQSDFSNYLATAINYASIPSRLEGRVVTVEFKGFGFPFVEYRGRFGATGTQTNYTYGQSCANILGALQAAPASTPLVSLQRFWAPGTSSYVYQAVWSPPLAPLPQLTVSASPVLLSVAQGSSVTFTITTTISGGFDSAVTLAASGEGGNTLTFSPSSIAAPGAGISTLTVEANSTGDYPITITATGGGITSTTNVTLEVITP